MALNPTFASASVNPSQSIGSDASAPAQGALPTGMTQNTGFSGLGGLDINYSAPKEPVIPNIANFNQSYYQSPQYRNYQNNLQNTMGTDDYRMMPFGGFGSGNIANLQSQSYDDFLKNPSMGQSGSAQGMAEIFNADGTYNPISNYYNAGVEGWQNQPGAPTYEQWQANPSLATEFQNRQAQQPNPALQPPMPMQQPLVGGLQDPQTNPFQNPLNDFKNTEQWQRVAPNYAGLPQNVQDYVASQLSQGAMDGGTNWKYNPTTQTFSGTPNGLTPFGNKPTPEVKSLAQMKDYVNWINSPNASTTRPPSSWDQSTQPTPMPQSNIARYDIPKNPDGSYNSEGVMVNQPQAKPLQSFFEGPTKGQIPNGFSMINGELVNLRGVPRSDLNTLASIAPQQPTTPATATPTGTTPMATNPLSTYATTPTTGSTPAPTLNATPGSASSGSFGQGGVLPNVTTTQQQVTAAPSFYTDYLNQLATQGGQASQNAQYVGAQPLQEQAFNQVSQNVGNYQPTLQNAINLAQNAGGMSAANVANPYIQGAALGSSLDVANPYIQSSASGSALNVANPYIQQAALGSSLDVANPYIQEAAQGSSLNAANPYLRAASQNAYSSVNNYMNPYVNEVVNQIGSLGQRQIQQSLAPQATAGLVGSGQFGSKRGAQALGQTISDANQNILSTQGQALNTGYQNAMQAAQADMARQLQAGSTAGQLSSADLARKLQAGTTAGQLSSTDLARLLQAGTTAGQLNTSDLARQLQAGATAGQLSTSDLARLLQSGATAGQLTSSDMQNRLATAGTLGNLAGSTQSLGLNDINALSTLGQQQQTIAQNEQLFPMQQLANQSALLRGYTIPTSVSASQTGPGQQGQFQTSPLQQIMSVGTLLGALAKPGVDGTSAGGNLVGGLESLINKITGKFSGSTGSSGTNSTLNPTTGLPNGVPGGATVQPDGTYVDSGGTKYIVNDDGSVTTYNTNGTFERSDPSNYDENVSDLNYSNFDPNA